MIPGSGICTHVSHSSHDGLARSSFGVVQCLRCSVSAQAVVLQAHDGCQTSRCNLRRTSQDNVGQTGTRWQTCAGDTACHVQQRCGTSLRGEYMRMEGRLFSSPHATLAVHASSSRNTTDGTRQEHSRVLGVRAHRTSPRIFRSGCRSTAALSVSHGRRAHRRVTATLSSALRGPLQAVASTGSRRRWKPS